MKLNIKIYSNYVAGKEQMDEIKYLRIIISSDGSIKKEVEARFMVWTLTCQRNLTHTSLCCLSESWYMHFSTDNE